MALRDVLEWERTFARGMPADWRDRPGTTVGGPFAVVSPSQSWTWDGKLVLGTKADPIIADRFLVGQVESVGTYSPFGYWEARVKFPTAPGVLAGWWLQSEQPYLTPEDVEIDIAENYGNPNVHHTLWWRDLGQPWGDYHDPPPHKSFDLGNGWEEPQADWHDYGVRVTPTGYTFFVDRVQSWQTHEGLTNTPKRPVFSIKVPAYTVGSIDLANMQALRMKVDWVRKYAP